MEAQHQRLGLDELVDVGDVLDEEDDLPGAVVAGLTHPHGDLAIESDLDLPAGARDALYVEVAEHFHAAARHLAAWQVPEIGSAGGDVSELHLYDAQRPPPEEVDAVLAVIVGEGTRRQLYISPVIADSPRTRGEANCDWKFQLAFPTAGDPKGWHNVNRGGWSDWWTIASS